MMEKTTIRRVGAAILAGILLWIIAIKGIHDIIHCGEHYQISSSKQIHASEHHCLLCDFEFPGFDDQTPHFDISCHSFILKIQNQNAVQAVICEPVSLFSSRAPPCA